MGIRQTIAENNKDNNHVTVVRLTRPTSTGEHVYKSSDNDPWSHQFPGIMATVIFRGVLLT